MTEGGTHRLIHALRARRGPRPGPLSHRQPCLGPQNLISELSDLSCVFTPISFCASPACTAPPPGTALAKLRWSQRFLESDAGPSEEMKLSMVASEPTSCMWRSLQLSSEVLWTLGSADRPWPPQRKQFQALSHLLDLLSSPYPWTLKSTTSGPHPSILAPLEQPVITQITPISSSSKAPF